MRLALSIALRYLFSRKRHNAVNVISLISVAGIAVAAMAMIVVLSVFNGFTDLAERQLSRIDPPLSVTPANGKVMTDADSVIKVVSQISPSSRTAAVISEQALAMTPERQMAVRLLGVPDEFVSLSHLDSITIDGECLVSATPLNLAMSSVGVALGLNRRPGDLSLIELYVPRRRGRISTVNQSTAFRCDSIIIAGVYQVEQESYDNDMLIVPLSVARALLDYTSEATAVHIYPDMTGTATLQERLGKALGPSYEVKNRLQQQSESFKMISVEKWITFLMLIFILVIASFNIVSTMSMLIIEKEGNMDILKAMGASNRFISNIFVIQGWLISILGGIVGIAAGLVLCLAQQWGGLIKLNASNAAALSIDAYPVSVSPYDILIVSAVIAAVGFVTGLAAVRK